MAYIDKIQVGSTTYDIQDSNLKSALKNITGNEQIQYSDPSKRQYIVTNGTTVQWDTPSTSASTQIKWAVVECVPGDQFIISGRGGNSDRLWAFADASKNLLDPRASAGATASNLVLTAPANAAYLILNSETDVASYSGAAFLVDRVEALEEHTAEYQYNNMIPISGAGSTLIRHDVHFIPGRNYAAVISGQWTTDSIAAGNAVYQLRSSTNVSPILNTKPPFPSIVFFTADSEDYYLFIRADVGEEFYITFIDVTPANLAVEKFDDNAHFNVYRNTQQLANVKWTPLKTIRAGEGELPAGVERTSVPYSSVKEYLKYVGIDVSLHTFMTAVHDEHSLLYTETTIAGSGSRSAYGRTYHGVNCYCYYGTVCSGFVTTGIGSKIQYNSWEFQTFPESFDVLRNQDTKGLEIGDIMSYDGHCGIITKIARNAVDGTIATLEFDEQSAPIHIGAGHTPITLHERAITNNGVWCRAKRLSDNTEYTPSPFVLADKENLYNVGDIVFQDGVSERTYYICRTANRDSEFMSGKWQAVFKWQSGQNYTSLPTTYRAYGDDLYQCVQGHTSGSTFDPSKWHKVDGIIEWAAYPYVYNDDIVTFAGDRAAFHSNDLIYINYTKGSYTSMQLYKDGALIQTITLPSSGYQINVSSYCTDGGMYKARLTNGTQYSRYTYFEVIDTNVSASYSNGEAEITFTVGHGTPLEWQIVELSGATVCHNELSQDEIASGRVVVNPKAKAFAEKYIYPHRVNNYSASIYARVEFVGEYGNVVNEMIPLGTLSNVSGELVFPWQPRDIGTISAATNVLLSNRMHGNKYSFTFTGGGASVSVLPAIGEIKWINPIPANPTSGTAYLVTVDNGIGNVAAAG